MSMIIFGIALLAIVLLFIYIIFLVKGVSKKLQQVEIKNAIADLVEDKKTYKMMGFEEALTQKLSIPTNKIGMFLIAERALFVFVGILLYAVLGILGIALIVAIAIAVIMQGHVQAAVEKSGVSRIPQTVSFMNYFVPQIAAGASAKDALAKYIEKLDPDNPDKELLTEYFVAKESNDYTYETPKQISDITSAYENAEYNERLGSDNYLYIIEEAKKNLFQKSIYYQDYQTSVGKVVKPIRIAYYCVVPFIIFILWGTVGDFWCTPAGWITAGILLFLFFLFNLLCNKLTISTLKTIVG